MAQTAPNVVRYSLLGRWSNSRPVITVLAYAVADDGTRLAAVSQAAGVVRDAWQTHVMPLIADNYTLEGVSWVDLDAVDGSTGTIGPNSGLPADGGSAGLSAASPNTALLVRKNLEGAQRNTRRGRMYLPPGTEGAIDEDGLILGTQITIINAALAAFLTATTITSEVGNVVSMHQVVVHWPSIPDPEAKPPPRIPDPDGVGTPTQVVSLIADQLIATQRRRVRP